MKIYIYFIFQDTSLSEQKIKLTYIFEAHYNAHYNAVGYNAFMDTSQVRHGSHCYILSYKTLHL